MHFLLISSFEFGSVVMIGDKHPDGLSSNPKVGIVIYEKFGVQNLRKNTIPVERVKIE
jgi:hypothetical protein